MFAHDAAMPLWYDGNTRRMVTTRGMRFESRRYANITELLSFGYVMVLLYAAYEWITSRKACGNVTIDSRI